MLMGVSLIHGGSGYPFFAPSIFSYLCGVDLSKILVTRGEIPNPDVESFLSKVPEEIPSLSYMQFKEAHKYRVIAAMNFLVSTLPKC